MRSLLVSTICILIALPASAQSTRSYEYDALGRLVKVTPNSGAPVCYTFDTADNRSNVTGGGSCTPGGGGGSNLAPTAVNDSAYLLYQETDYAIWWDGTIDVLSNDTDPDLPSDTLTITGISGPASSYVTNMGSYLWVDASLPDGSSYLTYQIQDAASHTSSATVSIEKYSYICHGEYCGS